MGIIEAGQEKPIDGDRLRNVKEGELVLLVNESKDKPLILLAHKTDKPESPLILELTRTGYVDEAPQIGASEAVALLKCLDFEGIKFQNPLNLSDISQFEDFRKAGLTVIDGIIGSIAGQKAFKYNTKAVVIGRDSVSEYLSNIHGYEIYTLSFKSNS